jgi:hypothetical protein
LLRSFRAFSGAVALSNASFWPHGDVWIVLAIVGVVILWLTRHGLPEPRSQDEAGEAATLARQDSRRMRRFFKGIGIAIGSVVALVLVAAAIAAAVFHVHVGNGIGDREYTVASASELARSYELGIGPLQLDLSQLSLPAGETRTLKARVDIGDIAITVPAGVSLHATARARAGNVRVLGAESNGWEVERVVSPGSQGAHRRRRRRRGLCPDRPRRTMISPCPCPRSQRSSAGARRGLWGIARALGVDVTLVGSSSRYWRSPAAPASCSTSRWLYADGGPYGSPAWASSSPGPSCHAVGLPTGQSRNRARRRGAGGRMAPRRRPPDAPLSYAGYALVSIGAVVLLAAAGTHRATPRTGCGRQSPPHRRAVALAARSTGTPSARRSAGGADVAARVRLGADARADPASRGRAEARRLARRQERELRGWLYADRPSATTAPRSSPRSRPWRRTSRTCSGSGSSSRNSGDAGGRRSCSPPARR